MHLLLSFGFTHLYISFGFMHPFLFGFMSVFILFGFTHPYIFVGLCTPNFFLRTIHHHHTPCTTCIWVLHTCNPFDWECSSYNTPCGYTSSLHLVDAPISFILHQEKKFLAIDHRLGTYVVVHGGPVSIDSHWSVVIWFSQESPHCYKVIARLSGLYIL